MSVAIKILSLLKYISLIVLLSKPFDSPKYSELILPFLKVIIVIPEGLETQMRSN